MTTKSNWKPIRSWNVGTPDGAVEKYTLYEDDSTGSIKVENDFGNTSIVMDRMSGYEFLKKLSKEVTDLLEADLSGSDWYGLDIDNDTDNDCDYTD